MAVAAEGPHARLTIRQERLDPAVAAGYGAGWDAHLHGLRAECEPGAPAADWSARFGAVHAAYRARLGG